MGLYARISKAGDQTPENQLIQLRQWATNSGAQIVGEFVDEISSRDTRPAKEEVLRKLRLAEIDGVAFYSLDRWGRTMSELVLEFEEATKRGWQLISLREGLVLDTAAGQLYAHMLAAFANFERERIKERTNAGLARARAQGKRFGRPFRSFDVEAARGMRQAGKSWRQIAVALKVPAATVRLRLATVQQSTHEKASIPAPTQPVGQ